MINNGANVNAKTNEGNTPLHFASIDNSRNLCLCFYLIKCLIDNGANINERNSKGESPLHYCVLKTLGTPSIKVVKYLIDNRADVNSKTKTG